MLHKFGVVKILHSFIVKSLIMSIASEQYIRSLSEIYIYIYIYIYISSTFKITGDNIGLTYFWFWLKILHTKIITCKNKGT